MRTPKRFLIGSAASAALAAALPLPALAHCPLCTVGAGLLAVAAASLGVSPAAIGVFIGAFAAALGLWLARAVKRRFIPFQRPLIALAAFFLTVIPLLPLFGSYTSVYLSIAGDYGSPLNRTYLINEFALGNGLGALILVAAPRLSGLIGRLRLRRLPYQGMILTFLLLLAAALAVQFLV